MEQIKITTSEGKDSDLKTIIQEAVSKEIEIIEGENDLISRLKRKALLEAAKQVNEGNTDAVKTLEGAANEEKAAIEQALGNKKENKEEISDAEFAHFDQAEKSGALDDVSKDAQEAFIARLAELSGWDKIDGQQIMSNDHRLDSAIKSLDVYDEKGELNPLYEQCKDLAATIQFDGDEGLRKTNLEMMLTIASQRATNNFLKDRAMTLKYKDVNSLLEAYKQEIYNNFTRSVVACGISTSKEAGIVLNNITYDQEKGWSYQDKDGVDMSQAIEDVLSGNLKINPLAIEEDRRQLGLETAKIERIFGQKNITKEKVPFYVKAKTAFKNVSRSFIDNMIKQGGWKKAALNMAILGGAAVATASGATAVIAAGAAVYAGWTAVNAWVMPVYDKIRAEMRQKGITDKEARKAYRKAHWAEAKKATYAEDGFKRRAITRTIEGVAAGGIMAAFGFGGNAGSWGKTLLRQGVMVLGKGSTLIMSQKREAEVLKEGQEGVMSIDYQKKLQAAQNNVKKDKTTLLAVVAGSALGDAVKGLNEAGFFSSLFHGNHTAGHATDLNDTSSVEAPAASGTKMRLLERLIGRSKTQSATNLADNQVDTTASNQGTSKLWSWLTGKGKTQTDTTTVNSNVDTTGVRTAGVSLVDKNGNGIPDYIKRPSDEAALTGGTDSLARNPADSLRTPADSLFRTPADSVSHAPADGNVAGGNTAAVAGTGAEIIDTKTYAFPNEYNADMGITKAQYALLQRLYTAEDLNRMYTNLSSDEVMANFGNMTKEEVLFKYQRLDAWTDRVDAQGNSIQGAVRYHYEEEMTALNNLLNCGEQLSAEQYAAINKALAMIDDKGDYLGPDKVLTNNVMIKADQWENCDEGHMNHWKMGGRVEETPAATSKVEETPAAAVEEPTISRTTRITEVESNIKVQAEYKPKDIRDIAINFKSPEELGSKATATYSGTASDYAVTSEVPEGSQFMRIGKDGSVHIWQKGAKLADSDGAISQPGGVEVKHPVALSIDPQAIEKLGTPNITYEADTISFQYGKGANAITVEVDSKTGEANFYVGKQGYVLDKETAQSLAEKMRGDTTRYHLTPTEEVENNNTHLGKTVEDNKFIRHKERLENGIERKMAKTAEANGNTNRVVDESVADKAAPAVEPKAPEVETKAPEVETKAEDVAPAVETKAEDAAPEVIVIESQTTVKAEDLVVEKATTTVEYETTTSGWIRGYNYGDDIIPSYSINEDGGLNGNIEFRNIAISKEDITSVHEACCRANGTAVDELGAEYRHRQLIKDYFVAQHIEHQKEIGEPVANGDKFIENFNQKLVKNGLEIGEDGKLQPTAENLKKPLYTTEQLKQQFNQAKAAQMRAFINNKSR